MLAEALGRNVPLFYTTCLGKLGGVWCFYMIGDHEKIKLKV